VNSLGLTLVPLTLSTTGHTGGNKSLGTAVESASLTVTHG
jgi:hypothetical protein